MRHHNVLHLKVPKPRSNNWTIEKCQQWLEDNPITNTNEIEYLKSRVLEQKLVQEEANIAKQLEVDALEKTGLEKYPIYDLFTVWLMTKVSNWPIYNDMTSTAAESP